MTPNADTMREFIALLTGDVNEKVTFQVFYDPKNEEIKRPDLAKHWVANLDDSLDFINWSQSNLCGVYVGVNKSDGKGRENSNIIGYRCLFADFDGMEEPQWPITPHFIQKRDDTHGHAFWLVSDIYTADEFKSLQKRIAMILNTDHQVTDPARVVRMSGTVHYKDPKNPAMYTVTDDNTDGDFKYTKQDIINAFPLSAQQDAELKQWLESRDGLLNGTGYELNERYINQTTVWLRDKAPIAVLGSGSHTVFKVAGYGHDHGIPLLEMQDMMWNIYNPRCEPPWESREQNQFNDIIERGYKYATSAAGCKTAIASFTHCGESIPEPIDGWKSNEKKDTIDFTPIERGSTIRCNTAEGGLLQAQINNKSPHYQQALVFDGVMYDGKNLIRCDKVFYTYNGKVWSTISDDVIKSNIQKFFSNYNPADSFVRGVLACLSDLTNVPAIQNGTWIDEDVNRDSDSVVVYNNGIVDLSKPNPELEPHNRNLFTFTMRSYDYKPNAKCPNFLKFLDSIWSDDIKLKMQLQEWMGYILTDDVSLQKFAILMGFSRGGKGVLANLMTELVGKDNTVAPSLSNLTKDSALDSMSTASLVMIPDAHSVALNKRDEVLSTFKAITGGDPIGFHRMYKGYKTTVFKSRFMLSTNNVPEFVDASGALANRMLVFPFYVSFKGRENHNLLNELIAEIEGIATWALEGLKRLRINGGKFTESESGLIEKQEIRDDMFPLAQYINSMCVIADGAETSTDILYSAYKLWASITGVKKPFTEIQFSKMLKNSELHLKPARTWSNGVRVRGFSGIKLSDDTTARLSLNFNRVVPISSAGSNTS